MQTSKILSNISYNTPEFLEAVLKRLSDNGIIDYWAFIHHKPEMETDPEADKKPHNHLLFCPSKRIQTKNIDKEFFENDPGKNLPLRCLEHWSIVNSFGDWWLYVLHDPKYLLHKNLVREYHYSIEDFHLSHKETFERMVGFIDLGKIYRQERIYNAAYMGLSFSQAYASGIFGDRPQAFANLYQTLQKEVLLEKQKKQIEETKAWAEKYKDAYNKIVKGEK